MSAIIHRPFRSFAFCQAQHMGFGVCVEPVQPEGYACAAHWERFMASMASTKTKPVRHGTLYAYHGLGCRCAECRACESVRQRQSKRRRRTEVVA